MADTGGAVSIASRHLLSNIKPAKKRSNPSCQMVTVNGLTPPYIRAIKIGSKVTVVMKTDLLNFNKKYVGKDSVFPEKNGALAHIGAVQG